MSLRESDESYSFKCALNSFASTYVAGILHPLDVIKTRFQSISYVIKVMMGSQGLKILYLSTEESSMLFRLSTERKDLEVCLKDIIFR